MIRETVKIKLTESYKKEAMELIDDTIKLVSNKYGVQLNDKEHKKIKNLSLDQINVNISYRNKCKTLWVFDTEDSIPIIVEKEASFKDPVKYSLDKGSYRILTNLTWTFNSKNLKDGTGITHDEFEKEVLKMLLEDFETAAFYGVLSYITESDKYER